MKNASDNNNKPLIVVVDDDKDFLYLLEQHLIKLSYQVLASHNGENLLDIISHYQPQLILLDIHMTGLSGIDVCQLIKRNGTTKTLPVLLLTAEIDADMYIKICGADGYINKPANASELENKILKALKKNTATAANNNN